MGQLKREGECGNVTSPFVTLDVTCFGSSWGEEQGTIAIAREVPGLGRESACLFAGILASPGTLWKFKMALLKSEEI